MTAALVAFALANGFAAWYLVRRVRVRLTLTSLTLALLLLLHGPALLVYLFVTGPGTLIYEAALSPVDPDATRARVLSAVALAFVLVPLGAELANTAFAGLAGRARRAALQQQPGPAPRMLSLPVPWRVGLWATALVMVAVSLAEGQPAKIAEYYAAGVSELANLLLRYESAGTPYYLYNVVLYSVAPYLAMVAYCVDRPAAGRRRWPLLAMALFAAVLLGKLGTLSKAPPAIFLLQLLLLRILLNRRAVDAKVFVLLAGAAFSLFLLVATLAIPELDVSSAGAFLYYRMLDIPNEVLVEYFAAIPRTLPHGWGGGIFTWLRDTPAAEHVPAYLAVADVTRDSLLSTSNVMFIGDAWAEFGWTGVVLFCVAAGFVVRAIDLYAFRNGETDEAACLVAGGSFGVFTLLTTALNTALVTGGLAILPLLSMALRRRALRSAGRAMVRPA